MGLVFEKPPGKELLNSTCLLGVLDIYSPPEMLSLFVSRSIGLFTRDLINVAVPLARSTIHVGASSVDAQALRSVMETTMVRPLDC